MPVLFCNVSWMKRYAGRDANDPPLGGGSFPQTQGYCGEECNFVPCEDGFVYGHFETLKNHFDRQVRLERLGAGKRDELLDGVDIVWTAPWEGNDPRVVVGWSRNARLYRWRQHFETGYPSDRHREAEIDNYRVKARVEDVVRLAPAQRQAFTLRRGTAGWSGQASWWYADDTHDPEAAELVAAVTAAMGDGSHAPLRAPRKGVGGGKGGSGTKGRAGAAASDPYLRYVIAYEAKIHPKHHKLQAAFKAHLRRYYKAVNFPPCYRDDLRYVVDGQPAVMAEIKPAETADLRFAIRTAMGQLLDYGEQQQWRGRRLIVVGSAVRNADDRRLALGNGFGLAWPDAERGFEILWPEKA